MSHFTVAVFSRNPSYEAIAELLAPYNECAEEEEFLEFKPKGTRETFEQEYRKYLQENPDKIGCYPDFESYMEQYHGYIYDEESDQYGYTHNPNAKWDWWQIGGRWDGLLRLKTDHRYEGYIGDSLFPVYSSSTVRCDQARLMDVDTSPDPEDYRHAVRFWEIIVEKMPLMEGEKEPWTFWKPEYYIQQYGNKESYARNQAAFSTYAFITPDGEWHETGTMGWWGIDNATAESRASYISNFEKTLAELSNDPEIYITIIDCHI